jgi:membrane-bound serine protease (ClpP class)
LRGARGVALSDLRPAGYARIGDRRVDVITAGGFIPAGTAIEIVADEGYRRVVRSAEPRTRVVLDR